jgi:hypothetical protein
VIVMERVWRELHADVLDCWNGLPWSQSLADLRRIKWGKLAFSRMQRNHSALEGLIEGLGQTQRQYIDGSKKAELTEW